MMIRKFLNRLMSLEFGKHFRIVGPIDDWMEGCELDNS
jgi:hypothetical protein